MAIPITHFTCDDIVMIQIPRIQNAQRHRASEWPKDTCWNGTMIIKSMGQKCFIMFENDGKLFAKADVSKKNSVDPVVDSGRYFVVVLTDDRSGRTIPMGIMFPKALKSRAWDFKVALQDWDKGGDLEEEVPELHRSLGDLSLGSGKITVNLKGKSGGARKTRVSIPGGTLAAPPTGLAPPSSSSHHKKKKKKKHREQEKKEADPFGSFEDAFAAPIAAAPVSSSGADPFGDFGAAFGAPSSASQQQQQQSADPFADWNF